MACKDHTDSHTSDHDEDEDEQLVEKFRQFCEVSGAKDRTLMNSKACGKMATDCFACYKKYDAKGLSDASVFSALKDKGKPTMVCNKKNCKEFVGRLAKAIHQKQTGNSKVAADDPAVKEIEVALMKGLLSNDPTKSATKVSKSGGVGRMTDTSKYTGSHKERFDESGKGKGAAGRTDKTAGDGYVHNYKGKGTHKTK